MSADIAHKYPHLRFRQICAFCRATGVPLSGCETILTCEPCAKAHLKRLQETRQAEQALRDQRDEVQA